MSNPGAKCVFVIPVRRWQVGVLPGITIHEGAIIGSGSVVTHDVAANCVVAGNPAKVIKQIKK